MAMDVKGFIKEHSLTTPAMIGHSMWVVPWNSNSWTTTNDPRGAKVAMTLALQSPELISALVPVDNAPVDTILKSDFTKYIAGMRTIEEERVTKQLEADEVLKTFEEVSFMPKISIASAELIVLESSSSTISFDKSSSPVRLKQFTV